MWLPYVLRACSITLVSSDAAIDEASSRRSWAGSVVVNRREYRPSPVLQMPGAVAGDFELRLIGRAQTAREGEGQICFAMCAQRVHKEVHSMCTKQFAGLNKVLPLRTLH